MLINKLETHTNQNSYALQFTDQSKENVNTAWTDGGVLFYGSSKCCRVSMRVKNKTHKNT